MIEYGSIKQLMSMCLVFMAVKWPQACIMDTSNMTCLKNKKRPLFVIIHSNDFLQVKHSHEK